MGEREIPQQVQSLISSHIDSVLQLEVLLLLQAQPQQDWTAEQVGRELRVDSGWAGGQLDNLCQRGILTCRTAPMRSYGYEPASPEMRDAITALADLYVTHRFTIIGMIFSKPSDKIRSFADAFRLRKDKPRG